MQRSHVHGALDRLDCLSCITQLRVWVMVPEEPSRKMTYSKIDALTEPIPHSRLFLELSCLSLHVGSNPTTIGSFMVAFR